MWWPRLGGVRPSPEGEPGTFHDAALDVTFLSSVCLGHEELGLEGGRVSISATVGIPWRANRVQCRQQRRPNRDRGTRPATEDGA